MLEAHVCAAAQEPKPEREMLCELQVACTASVSQYRTRQEGFTGYKLPAKDEERVTKRCIRECDQACELGYMCDRECFRCVQMCLTIGGMSAFRFSAFSEFGRCGCDVFTGLRPGKSFFPAPAAFAFYDTCHNISGVFHDTLHSSFYVGYCS